MLDKHELEEAARLRMEQEKIERAEKEAAREALRRLQQRQKRAREAPSEVLPAKLLSVLGR